jgi:hypothetical protein
MARSPAEFRDRLAGAQRTAGRMQRAAQMRKRFEFVWTDTNGIGLCRHR